MASTSTPLATMSESSSRSVHAVTSALTTTMPQSSASRPTVFRMSLQALVPMTAMTAAPTP